MKLSANTHNLLWLAPFKTTKPFFQAERTHTPVHRLFRDIRHRGYQKVLTTAYTKDLDEAWSIYQHVCLSVCLSGAV